MIEIQRHFPSKVKYSSIVDIKCHMEGGGGLESVAYYLIGP